MFDWFFEAWSEPWESVSISFLDFDDWNQGRIQDLKLGVAQLRLRVAQMGWIIWKRGGGDNYIKNTIIKVYIYIYIYIYMTTIYFNTLLIQYYLS